MIFNVYKSLSSKLIKIECKKKKKRKYVNVIYYTLLTSVVISFIYNKLKI